MFGGQVLAQALLAAVKTLEEAFTMHSMHGYFLRRGDYQLPIVFDVDRIRDGRSFATRRVKAVQHGKAVFNLACSFQRYEEGFETRRCHARGATAGGTQKCQRAILLPIRAASRR